MFLVLKNQFVLCVHKIVETLIVNWAVDSQSIAYVENQ